MSDASEPNPDWPPDVQRFVAGLRMYLLTLSEDEQRQLLQDIAIQIMQGPAEA